MDRRLELHDRLVSLAGGASVYFQPPNNLLIEYPCIVYHRSNTHSSFADDRPYINRRRYQLTVISRDPEEKLIESILELPEIEHQNFFASDGLNHDIFQLYF